MRTLSLLAAAALSYATLSVVPVPAGAAPPRAASSPSTTVTFVVPSCVGCELSVHSFVLGSPDVWDSRTKAVHDGRVSFEVPTDRTAGLSVMVRAPWEGATGFVTNAVFRYQGFRPGATVRFRQAHAARRASACWAGTTEAEVTLKLVVREVTVRGQATRVPGSLAWFRTTQQWRHPMVAARHGVVGTQDVMPCRS